MGMNRAYQNRASESRNGRVESKSESNGACSNGVCPDGFVETVLPPAEWDVKKYAPKPLWLKLSPEGLDKAMTEAARNAWRNVTKRVPEDRDVAAFAEKQKGKARNQLLEEVELLRSATTIGPPSDPIDPHRLAEVFLRRYMCRGIRTLYKWRGDYHRWDGTAYRVAEDDQIRNEVVAAIRDEHASLYKTEMTVWKAAGGCDARDDDKPMPKPSLHPVTQWVIGNVMQALASMVSMPPETEQPVWLDDSHYRDLDEGFGVEWTQPCPAECVLACRNGLVDLSKGVWVGPHVPMLFTTNALDYRFDRYATEPRQWLKFLSDLKLDGQSVKTLQEYFGLCLTTDTSYQKMLMLLGPTRAGKGTIARVLREVIGQFNCCELSLSMLGTNFRMWPLIGKAVAVVPDLKLSGRFDRALITERLLSIVGEDPQCIDRKYRSPWHGKLSCRFVLLTNELPKLDDNSGGLAARLIVIRLTESFLGREDKGLTERLLTERTAILNWAIAGLKRLRKGGHFIQPEPSAEVVTEVEELSSDVKVWFKQCGVEDPTRFTTPEQIYESWCSWCVRNDKRPGAINVFCRDLNAAHPALKTRRRVKGVQRTCYHVGLTGE
jgi:putative DNA primase/helicase